MSSVCRAAYLAATGDVTVDGANLRGIVLRSAAVASNVEVRTGGAAGTLLLKLAAPPNGTAAVTDLPDPLFMDGVHITLVGVGASVAVFYT